MKKYRVLMTEPAANDLQEVVRYIAGGLREPATAQKLVDKIRDAVMSLAEMPNRHPLAADGVLAAKGIRKVPVENYIVFYVVSEEDETVTVLRILLW